MLFGCTAIVALAIGAFGDTGSALAQDQAQAGGNAPSNDQMETIVVTGTRFNTDAAPAKSSIETVEPQTVINRSYIENFVPPQADYVTILAIVPSMTGGDPNGPGLSDGGEKNSLRGLGDGQYVQQFDGIPFGDTNGPTHHNISYFPASTIGSIIVDRGPGMASNMGPATFGGTVKIFSLATTPDPHAGFVGSTGSFDTHLAVLTGQSGDLEFMGTTTRVLVNLQGLESNGALSLQDLRSYNALVKIETDITDDWKVTLLTNYSWLKEHLDDNNGLTPAQVAVFGKDFSLQNTNPLLPTYYAYNYTTKATDFDYFRVTGKIIDGVEVENLGYTYAYWNHTFSPNSQIQTLPQILAGTSADNATLKSPLPLLNGKTSTSDLLAYDKENRYRVWGDILKVSEDYDLGWVSGQVREGVWLEEAHTNRFKYFFDANLCNAELINPFYVGGGAAASACGAVSGAAKNDGLGFAKDDEHSGWYQYQPFLEIDIKPLENLVITPGVKYVHWDHTVDAPIEQGNLCGINFACPPFNAKGQDFTTSFVTRQTLPFLTVNYKITPSWSVYFEYAKGIYVPDISQSFEISTTKGIPPGAFPQAENTTNYQFGTVFYADNFTFDADIYYIPVSNNIVVLPCSFASNEACASNNGSATYKGIEGEMTYAFDQEVFGVDLEGLSFFASGSVMSSKITSGQFNGNWEPNAPKWTAAAGVIYHRNGWTFSLFDKSTGPSYNDNANFAFYILPNWNNVTLTAGYAFDWFGGNYELTVNVDNLLNTRATTVITEGGSAPQTDLTTSTDQLQFQAPISAFVALKIRY